MPRRTGAPAVVLYGLGGVGKSTLAAQYAQTYRESYDLVWWIDAASPGSIEAALAELTTHLSSHWVSVTSSMTGHARAAHTAWALSWLQQHDGWLLVYDNVEDPSVLDRYVGSLVSGHHLVTSRRSGDWRALGTAIPLEVLPQHDAVDLLHSYLPDLTPTPTSRWEASQLARELGCLPLALNQAGAYIAESVITFATYRRRLDRRLDEQAQGDRNGPERTIARIWSLTLAAVTERNPLAAEFLYALAWLDPDGCPRELLDRLAPDELAAERALTVLNAFNMITLTEQEVRVHRLVQSVLRADAADAAADPLTPAQAPDPRGRREIERAVVEAVYPEGTDVPADTRQLALLARHTCALAGTDAVRNHSPQLTLLYGYTAVHLRDEGRLVQAFPLHKACSEQLERGFGKEHPLTLIGRNGLASAYEAVGKPGEARMILEALLVSSTRVRGAGHLTTLNIHGNLASAYQSLGMSQKAVSAYESAVATSREALGGTHIRTLTLQGDLAGLYNELGRHGEAINLYESLVRHAAAFPTQREHPVPLLEWNGARTRMNLAGAYESVGRYEEAIELYRAVHPELEQAYGSDHPDTLTCLANLGYTLESAGEFGEARNLYDDVLARRERILGELHPDTLMSRSNLANLCTATGDLDRGLELSELTLAQRTQVLGPDHPDTLVSRNNLASCYVAVGDLDRAMQMLEETVALHERLLGPEHPATLLSRNNLASCYFRRGDAGCAVPQFEAVLAVQEQLFGLGHPATMLSRQNLASACREAGDLERALDLITTVIKQRTEVLGPNHPDTLASLGSLARLHEARGELDRAIPLYQSVRAQLTEVVGPDHPTTEAIGDHLAAAVQARKDGVTSP